MCHMKLGTIVGHIPREFLRYFWLEVVEEYILVKIVEEGSTVKDWKFHVRMYTFTGRKKKALKMKEIAACEKWML